MEAELAPNFTEIQCDPDKLKQVVINYHQRCRSHGRIRQHFHQNEEYRSGVEIQVSDEGIGISDEDIIHIFEPFYTTRDRGSGWGLPFPTRLWKPTEGNCGSKASKGRAPPFLCACPVDTIFSNFLIDTQAKYYVSLIAAGWSSLVARRAHNPKVGGSNPPPATIKKARAYVNIVGPFLLARNSLPHTRSVKNTKNAATCPIKIYSEDLNFSFFLPFNRFYRGGQMSGIVVFPLNRFLGHP
jgi:hypothetical protein